MEDYSPVPMMRTSKIIRRSIFIFLKNYQFFSTTACFLAFPFAASFLILQSIIPSSSLFPIIHERLHLLFDAAGLPSSSEFFALLNSKISQTIAISFLAFPFTVSYFLFSKTSVIQSLKCSKESPQESFFSIYAPILLTYLFNSLLIISANATCFTILFFSFNLVDLGFGLSSPRLVLFLSATGAVLCSIILANTLIICNMALVVSGKEKIGGLMAILKACVLIRRRTATALSLAVPANLALAGVEALFQYRIIRGQEKTGEIFTMAIEAMFIAYMYSILLVLDTIATCVFYTSCKKHEVEILPIQDRDQVQVLKIKTFQEFPQGF